MLQLNKNVCVFVCVCTNRKSQHTHTHTSCCTFMEDIKSVCARQLVRRLLHKLVAVARLGRSPPLLRPSYLYMKSRKKATSLVALPCLGVIIPQNVQRASPASRKRGYISCQIWAAIQVFAGCLLREREGKGCHVCVNIPPLWVE